jgi:hypothetical protein
MSLLWIRTTSLAQGMCLPWFLVLMRHCSSFPYRAHGFFCAGCPKLFSKPSPALTKTSAIKEHADTHKRTRELKNRHSTVTEDRSRIRGMSEAKHIQPQDSSLGSAYDGSYGVDTEDILGIPQIAFSTFQMFPDQFQYAPTDSNLSSYNNTIQMGLEWIKKQARTAKRYDSHNISEIWSLIYFIMEVWQACCSHRIRSCNPKQRSILRSYQFHSAVECIKHFTCGSWQPIVHNWRN